MCHVHKMGAGHSLSMGRTVTVTECHTVTVTVQCTHNTRAITRQTLAVMFGAVHTAQHTAAQLHDHMLD